MDDRALVDYSMTTEVVFQFLGTCSTSLKSQRPIHCCAFDLQTTYSRGTVVDTLTLPRHPQLHGIENDCGPSLNASEAGRLPASRHETCGTYCIDDNGLFVGDVEVRVSCFACPRTIFIETAYCIGAPFWYLPVQPHTIPKDRDDTFALRHC